LPLLRNASVEGRDLQIVADVVHEHVGASVRSEHVVAEGVDRCGVPHVAGERVGVPTGGHDGVRGLGSRGFVDVGDHDSGAVLGEERRSGAPDAVCRTGDDGDPAVEQRFHERDHNVSA
jgi:hypothetical protein